MKTQTRGKEASSPWGSGLFESLATQIVLQPVAYLIIFFSCKWEEVSERENRSQAYG